MSNTNRGDFVFTAAVLSQIDAIDICDVFGLAPVVDASTVSTVVGRKAPRVAVLDNDDGGDVFAPMGG